MVKMISAENNEQTLKNRCHLCDSPASFEDRTTCTLDSHPEGSDTFLSIQIDRNCYCTNDDCGNVWSYTIHHEPKAESLVILWNG